MLVIVVMGLDVTELITRFHLKSIRKAAMLHWATLWRHSSQDCFTSPVAFRTQNSYIWTSKFHLTIQYKANIKKEKKRRSLDTPIVS